MPSTVYRNIKKRGGGIAPAGVYRGRRTQRGHGIGSFFTKLAGKVLKFAKPIASKVGRVGANIGKEVVQDAVKKGARQAVTYAKRNKGNIAKSVAGTVGASVLGAVGERIGNNKKGETKQVKQAVKQAKKADTQMKQGIKRKFDAIEKIENAVTKPPVKRRRRRQRGRALDSIF